jgi:hypothetical protein
LKAKARRVLLHVEGLDGPPIGAGCCGALTREDLLVEELDSWPGLLTLDVDPEAGTAAVLVSRGSADLEHALQALADQGLHAQVLRDQPAR